VKIRSVTSNNRRNEFTVVTRSRATYTFPYTGADPQPNSEDRLEEVFVDKELGNEAFTYILGSGEEGSIHIEQVLEYNEAPRYLAELLVYKLTLEAQEGIEGSGLSMRQIAKRLKTSVPQLYRLLDSANMRKFKMLMISGNLAKTKVDLHVQHYRNNYA
jgi:hypothetical protein